MTLFDYHITSGIFLIFYLKYRINFFCLLGAIIFLEKKEEDSNLLEGFIKKKKELKIFLKIFPILMRKKKDLKVINKIKLIN